MNVGPIVRAARERRGLTQTELARRAGISEVSLRHIERGRRDPSLATLRQLLTALGLRGELRVSQVRSREDDARMMRLTPQERREELDRVVPGTLLGALLALQVRFAVGGELALLIQGVSVRVREVALVLWDDDENLVRAVEALRAVGAGPASDEDLATGYDDLYAMAYASTRLGPKEIRRQQDGWWMCQESSRMRVGLAEDDPTTSAVQVTVEVWGERLTVPAVPSHVVTRDDPGLAAVVGSGAWNTPT